MIDQALYVILLLQFLKQEPVTWVILDLVALNNIIVI